MGDNISYFIYLEYVLNESGKDEVESFMKMMNGRKVVGMVKCLMNVAWWLVCASFMDESEKMVWRKWERSRIGLI